MRPKRRFWQESDSTVSFDEPFELFADNARQRQQLIGVELRRWYRDIADEPVPDEWLQLLNQNEGSLENGQTRQSERTGST